MSRRAGAAATSWAAVLHLAAGWVTLPAAGGRRQPLFPSRDPYLRAARELAAGGSIPDDMVAPTHLFLSHIIPASAGGLAAAGRVRATSRTDASLESCWVNGPIPATWGDVGAMTEHAAGHVLADPATSPPVTLPADLGPAVRFERRSPHPDYDLDETVTYVVWATGPGVGLVIFSGYTGSEGLAWDRFLADMDAMVATLELTGSGGVPAANPS
jgi:hypothetical protein